MAIGDFVLGCIFGWCLGLGCAVAMCERLGHRNKDAATREGDGAKEMR